MSSDSNGDPRALYEAHRDDIYRYLLKLSRNPDLAEDLTQDVFLKVIENFDRFDSDKGTFTAWACTIAHNTFVNHVGRAANRDTTFDDALEHSLASGDDPARQVEADILSKKIREIIMALPEPERRIFYLMKVKSFSRDQIGRELNMSTRTVSRKLVNAVELLRKELGKQQLLPA